MPSANKDESNFMLREGRFALLTLLLAMLPVGVLFALRGYSCGHDLPFHLGSWQDAAQQLRHGAWPQWDFMAARSAGEPRFVFYPPVSWLVGAALRAVLAPEHAAVAFVLLALACCWGTMCWAAQRTTTGAAAAIAGVVFALGPYMFFNALERAADAELLAMAWLPLLFVAVMRERPRVTGIAVPLALLWLTNVPTAIIGSYLVVLLGVLRLLQARRARRLVAVLAIGAGVGIGLAGFFLVPAVHQQAAVQIDGAFSEGQTYTDNFLLRHSAHTRRGVIHAVSVMTAEELAVLLAALALVAMRLRHGVAGEDRQLPVVLAAVAAVVVFLMLPWSGLVWAHLPKLSVLQFPWRLLCVLSMLLAFAVGMLLRPILSNRGVGAAFALVLAAALAWSGFHQFWLDPLGHEDGEPPRAQMLQQVERRATGEYTPVGDDNATLRASTPGFWLQVRATGSAGGVGHGDSVQNAQPLPHTGTDARAPGHLELELAQPERLVLDLRAYPQWQVTRNGLAVALEPRADGLIALALPAGPSVVDVRWKSGLDRWVGYGVSLGALLLLCGVLRRERRGWV